MIKLIQVIQMADKDLEKNLKKMQGSGYISEDLKVEVGTFSLEGLNGIDDENSGKDESSKAKSNESNKEECKDKDCEGCK